MFIASKRVLLPVAIVAMSGFLFEASAADPVIAAKVAKAPDLAAGAADPAWAQAKAVTVALAGGANLSILRTRAGTTTSTMKTRLR